MSLLDGQTALVTGGGRGIGRGIVLEMAKEGCDIVIADIDLENAQETATEIRNLSRKVTVVEMDVTRESSVAAGLKRTNPEHSRIDILVNNAGVVGNHIGDEVDLKDWDMCYQVNLKGIWIVSRAIKSHFLKNGGGKIVNISSVAGRHGDAALAHYSASKAGAISVTQSLAKELGRFNINVNAVCPGVLWTNMWHQLEAMFSSTTSAEAVNQRKVFERHIERNCPLGREQTPQDIGMAVAFLASDRARNITGQTLNVDETKNSTHH